VRKRLDAEAMHAAAQALVGSHDFTTFRDLACQAKSPMKTLMWPTSAARATR
jgi:tRNA pseudouridine38-40 synthase